MFKKRIIQIANVLAEKINFFFTTILFRVIETKIFIICSVAIIRCNTFFGLKLKFVINFLKILNKNDKIQQKK